MRDYLNSVLTFIGAESLTDEEFASVTLENILNEVANYQALLGILQSRESVSDMILRLQNYFLAKGVQVVTVMVTDNSDAKSNIFVGGGFEGLSGDQIQMGKDGAPGSVWRNGSGAPSNGTGIDGDYYLRTSNGDVYKKTSGTYSVVGNIKGATGAAGANGTNGIDGADGSDAPDGSITNAKLATAPAYTLKGNKTNATAVVGDLTVEELRTLLRPDSEIILRGFNSVGSNGHLIRWNHIDVNNGSDLSVVQSSTDGDYINVNVRGRYLTSLTWQPNDEAPNEAYWGITLNQSDLTKQLYQISNASGEILSYGYLYGVGDGVNTPAFQYVVIKNLEVNDKIRFITSRTPGGDSAHDDIRTQAQMVRLF